jgi:hypothetical protein
LQYYIRKALYCNKPLYQSLQHWTISCFNLETNSSTLFVGAWHVMLALTQTGPLGVSMQMSDVQWFCGTDVCGTVCHVYFSRLEPGKHPIHSLFPRNAPTVSSTTFMGFCRFCCESHLFGEFPLKSSRSARLNFTGGFTLPYQMSSIPEQISANPSAYGIVAKAGRASRRRHASGEGWVVGVGATNNRVALVPGAWL